ncbi:MAG: HAD hydrolase-like protein [Paracoccaceae bacterium]
MSKSFYVRPGVFELVDALKKSKIKIAVATSTSTDNVMKLFSLIWGNEAQKLFSVISTILAPSEFTRGDNFSDADLIVENLSDSRVKKFLGLS